MSMSVTQVEISQNWSRELSRKELEEGREERGEEEGGNGVRQC